MDVCEWVCFCCWCDPVVYLFVFIPFTASHSRWITCSLLCIVVRSVCAWFCSVLFRRVCERMCTGIVYWTYLHPVISIWLKLFCFRILRLNFPLFRVRGVLRLFCVVRIKSCLSALCLHSFCWNAFRGSQSMEFAFAVYFTAIRSLSSLLAWCLLHFLGSLRDICRFVWTLTHCWKMIFFYCDSFDFSHLRNLLENSKKNWNSKNC